jgi:ribonuclease D
MADLQGVPPKLVQRVGRQLLDAIEASARDEESYQPPRPPDEGQKSLLKEMQARVAACAEELGITAETLASKRELSAVIISGSRNSRVFSGWRAELIGRDLEALM